MRWPAGEQAGGPAGGPANVREPSRRQRGAQGRARRWVGGRTGRQPRPVPSSWDPPARPATHAATAAATLGAGSDSCTASSPQVGVELLPAPWSRRGSAEGPLPFMAVRLENLLCDSRHFDKVIISKDRTIHFFGRWLFFFSFLILNRKPRNKVLP